MRRKSDDEELSQGELNGFGPGALACSRADRLVSSQSIGLQESSSHRANPLASMCSEEFARFRLPSWRGLARFSQTGKQYVRFGV
jgi:hypothetical protein